MGFVALVQTESTAGEDLFPFDGHDDFAEGDFLLFCVEIKAPLRPFREATNPILTSLWRILAVKNWGDSISRAISTTPGVDPSLLRALIYTRLRMAYSVSFENMAVALGKQKYDLSGKNRYHRVVRRQNQRDTRVFITSGSNSRYFCQGGWSPARPPGADLSGIPGNTAHQGALPENSSIRKDASR